MPRTGVVGFVRVVLALVESGLLFLCLDVGVLPGALGAYEQVVLSWLHVCSPTNLIASFVDTGSAHVGCSAHLE